MKLGGVTIKEVYFVGLDEWRYFVPIPAYKMVDARSDDYQLYWKRSSLEFKLMKRIGRFYPVYPTIESFAQKCEIEIID